MNGPEFSRPLAVEEGKIFSSAHHISANGRERANLADLLGVVTIRTLEAELRFNPAERAVITMTGHLDATVVQKCVVTLKPVESLIAADFERTYTADEGVGDIPGDGDITIPASGHEPPDLIIDGIIDLGQAVAEQLALEIDPFPRASGAVFTGLARKSGDSGKSGPDGVPSGPFASLSRFMADGEEKPK